MRRRKTQSVLLVCGLALSVSGCQKRMVQAAPPVIVPAAEEPQQTQPTTQPEPETPPTDNPETSAPTPTNKTAPNPVPKKTVPPAATPPDPEPAAPKPSAPRISPELSPEEQARDQQRAQQNIAAAEQNLQKIYNRGLTATQHDLVEKIRGFLAQAREAIRDSDWLRARNTSEKAYLLSVELAKSL